MAERGPRGYRLAGRGLWGRRSYDDAMTSAGYLRFPHIHGDLLTFVAEDDVWLAPLGGGRAWRLSADRAEARQPAFFPRRALGGLDELARRPGRGVPGRRGRRAGPPPHLLERSARQGVRLDAGRRGAGPERERAGLRAAGLGVRRTPRRGRTPAAAVRPGRGRGPGGRRASAAQRHLGTRPGVLEALPRRHRGTAVDLGGRCPVPAHPGRPGRPVRQPHAGR